MMKCFVFLIKVDPKIVQCIREGYCGIAYSHGSCACTVMGVVPVVHPRLFSVSEKGIVELLTVMGVVPVVHLTGECLD